MTEKTRHTLSMLVLAGGFALLAVEVRYHHDLQLAKYPIAWTPIVYSGLAVLACLMALSHKHQMRTAMAIFLGLGVIVGGLGLREHTEGEPAKALMVLEPLGYKTGRAPEVGPPPLAPLSMAGLGLLGAILVWPKDRRRRESG